MPSATASAHASSETRAPAGPGSRSIASSNSADAACWSRTRSVSIQAGWIVPTATPLWATSSRSALAKCSTPAFDAQYVVMPGNAP